ncbi:NADP+-dependent D-mannitol dehydrogenase [Gloeophyllum trabeum ATCC 11539]|uniref:NADP+-dependent D-mannitol dehydrogenase n=1 Tax=Gloeophyllum trabeum (strain ATCC 11539 / FP-39264 / Madison 617) TaxID=670483 RepID=S7RQI6_GLOTA|nr:NADP+-dependent D-mannitol dehydrogenase [Gloeophyllum trabeum ATCC 11539]EPQ56845.1 NADP+-dependent D-mannitol dehydrogenase [Gloeophyllum trabeum ATCC 11539]
MKAVVYKAPKKFTIQNQPVPRPGKGQILIKGVCGSDLHIHSGDFPVPCPLIPGHEATGIIETLGENVTGFNVGDRCVAEPVIPCSSCFFCRRGNMVMCEAFDCHGVTVPGGFAEYMVVDAIRVFRIHDITDEEAVLVEPTSCALHAMDRLRPGDKVGIDALVIGAGPSGLVLAQLLKLNGAANVVIAAPAGPKMEIAKRLEAGDQYIELDRDHPELGWKTLQTTYSRGFNVVIEATGSEGVANRAMQYVRRGGTLLLYSIYAPGAQVHWPPSKIFGDEIEVIGSYAQSHCFPRAIEYIESGKIKVRGLVTDVYKLDEWDKVIKKMGGRDFVKIAVKP